MEVISIKTGSVSFWAWITGGILVGILVFTFIYVQIIGISRKTRESQALEKFSELKRKINDLCSSIAGSEREFKIVLTENVEGVYLTDNEHKEVKNIQKKIRDFNVSKGRTVCLKLKSEDPRCLNLDCKASMHYIGSLQPKSSVRSFLDKLTRRKPSYTFNLNLEKTGNNVSVRRKV